MFYEHKQANKINIFLGAASVGGESSGNNSRCETPVTPSVSLVAKLAVDQPETVTKTMKINPLEKYETAETKNLTNN